MIFVPPYSLLNSGNLALHLYPEHLADLRASGLADETIRAAGVYSLRPCDIALFFGRKGPPAKIQTSLCFPYRGGTFARIKLFPSLGKFKYSQPPGTSARLYIPFPVTDGPVYVCEGEKKTLAAHQAHLNAVGIGGVWSWLSKGEPIDDLQLVEWENRDAIIIPDSDVFERPDLMRAIYALGRELREHGAAVTVARIPQEGQDKLGLDDYLVAGGAVADLETHNLSERVFSSARWWFGKWKLKRVLEAA
jgi:putative DNA primase/helicase